MVQSFVIIMCIYVIPMPLCFGATVFGYEIQSLPQLPRSLHGQKAHVIWTVTWKSDFDFAKCCVKNLQRSGNNKRTMVWNNWKRKIVWQHQRSMLNRSWWIKVKLVKRNPIDWIELKACGDNSFRSKTIFYFAFVLRSSGISQKLGALIVRYIQKKQQISFVYIVLRIL